MNCEGSSCVAPGKEKKKKKVNQTKICGDEKWDEDALMQLFQPHFLNGLSDGSWREIERKCLRLTLFLWSCRRDFMNWYSSVSVYVYTCFTDSIKNNFSLFLYLKASFVRLLTLFISTLLHFSWQLNLYRKHKFSYIYIFYNWTSSS